MVYRADRAADAQEEVWQVAVCSTNLQVTAQQTQGLGGQWQDKNRSCLPLINPQRSCFPIHRIQLKRCNLARAQAVIGHEVQNGVVAPIAGVAQW